jgi:hypothetical protein
MVRIRPSVIAPRMLLSNLNIGNEDTEIVRSRWKESKYHVSVVETVRAQN